MLQTVTPLNKGTKGKLRRPGCAATFRRVAYGALVRSEGANLAKVFGPTQYAVGRKAALESLERHPGGDQNTMQRCRGTIRLQLGIQPRGPHDDSVSHSPPVSAPCTLFLQHPFAHHAQSGSQGRRCSHPGFSSITRSFLLSHLAGGGAGEDAEAATDLFAYLDDLTLVTEERFLEDAIRTMESALAKARLIVNEMKSLDIYGHETERCESGGHVG